jgi:hypothetical protein
MSQPNQPNQSNQLNPIKDIINIQNILTKIKSNDCKINNCFNELNALSFYVGDYNVKSMVKKNEYYGLISYDKNYNFELKYSPHYV